MQKGMEKYSSDLKNALTALKNEDFRTFQDAIKKVDAKDINYYFRDPGLSTLLDLSCRRRGCHQFVRELLNHGADPNIVNHIRGSAPLHFAVKVNDFETVAVLLNHAPTNVNIADSRGDTALHIAVKLNSEIVDFLIKNRADVNALNRQGESILLTAVQEECINKECIKLILESGSLDLKADPKFSKAEKLLNDIYPEWNTIYKPKNDSTPVSYSFNSISNLLHSGNYDGFIYHIRQKKDDKEFSEYNDGLHTFLQHCCEFGLVEVVDELLLLEVDVNTTPNSDRRTPLMIASYKGYFDVVRMLLDTNKCSFEPVDQETVFHCIAKGFSVPPGLGDNDKAKKDHQACLSLLLQVGSCKKYINFSNGIGNTPLHLAAKLADSEIILMLLKGGASINCFNKLDEPSFVDISHRTLKEYLDSCVYTNNKPPQEES